MNIKYMVLTAIVITATALVGYAETMPSTKSPTELKKSLKKQPLDKTSIEISKNESSGIDDVPVEAVSDALFQFTKFAVQIPAGSPEGLDSARNELMKKLTEWGIIIEPNIPNSEFTFTLKGKLFDTPVSMGKFSCYQAEIILSVVRVNDGSIIAGPKTIVFNGPVNLNKELAKQGAFKNAAEPAIKYIVEEVLKKQAYIVRRIILVKGIPEESNLLWIQNGLMTKPGIEHVRITEYDAKTGRATIEIACSSRVAENIPNYIRTLPDYPAALKVSKINGMEIKAEFTE